MKEILVLGGTGAMGAPLVSYLAEQGYNVFVTTRGDRESKNNKIQYVKGNAHEIDFLKQVLSRTKWEAVIDFMVYSTDEFRERIELLLSNTFQYIFISSARVYAKCDSLITEEMPRLLDVCHDTEYLKTDEYALTKARQEDVLFHSGSINWTIIRPSLTYNDYRLQLGVLEKEHWLYRAMHGRSIVFSEDIRDKCTAMTAGWDVTKGIAGIIGKEEALGEAFHITESKSYDWGSILEVYLDIIENYSGKRPKVVFTKKTTCFDVGWNRYQIIYCRYYNRRFDNRKINKFVDTDEFTDMKSGIKRCLNNFLHNPKFNEINWKLEAVNDTISREWTPLKEIPGNRRKVVYIIYRLGIYRIINRLRRK